METVLSESAWEAMYAPYDPATYQAVLDRLSTEDVVLDIGAGDLRLARRMARVGRTVYAIEIDPRLVSQCGQLPHNLILIQGDARRLDFPPGVTTGVLLMRHCRHYWLYAAKLRRAGASRLITNARWHLDVEVVDLVRPPISYADAAMGWYACSCGHVGFKEGPAEDWSCEMDRMTNEVSNCPECLRNGRVLLMERL